MLLISSPPKNNPREFGFFRFQRYTNFQHSNKWKTVLWEWTDINDLRYQKSIVLLRNANAASYHTA